MRVDGPVADVRQRLVRLGLAPDVADIYLHLLLMGPSRPATLAQATGMSRAEAYRRLALLEEAGLATSDEKPRTFQPVAPRLLLQALHESSLQRASRSQEAAAAVEELDDWTQFADPGVSFRRRVGRQGVYEEIHRLLDDAQEQVLVVNTHPHGVEMAQEAGLWKQVDDLVGKGVAFRALMTTSPPAEYRDRLPVRLLEPRPIIRFMVVDRSEALLTTTVDASPDLDSPFEQAVTTGAPGFVSAYRMLFEHLWRDAASPDDPAARR